MRGRPIATAVLLALLAGGPASAQLLDLGAAPQAPAAGAGVATRALAESLAEEARTLAAGGDPAAMARASARTLASRLIATGEAAGQAGSARIVLGRTLVRGLLTLDRIVADVAGPTAAADLSLGSRDLSAAAAALESPEADAPRLVRDALAGLLALGADLPPAGWPEEPGAAGTRLDPDLETWAAAPGVSPDAIAALRDLDAALTAADAWAAYRRSAVRTRSLIRSAAAGLTVDAGWLSPEARSRFGEEFSSAALALTAEPAAIAGLMRLAKVARLIEQVGALDDSNASKRVKQAVAAAIVAPADSERARTLDDFDRVLTLLQFRPEDEKKIIRQVRPAWRIVAPMLRQTEQKLLPALADILARPEAMTDPAVLSAVASHTRVVQDLELLARLSATLAAQGIDSPAKPGSGGPQPRWNRIADRVLKLGQDMARPDGRDAALDALRELAGQLERHLEFPGEASLRADGPAWNVLTGGKQSALRSEISDRRGGWLDGWDKQGYAGSAGDLQRLAALRPLMDTLDALAPVVQAIDARAAAEGPYALLQAWPGWELSPESLGELCRGLSDRTAEAVAHITGGDAGKTTETVERIRREFAVAILAGRMAREAEQRGLKAGSEEDSLGEAAAGAPLGGWLEEHLPTIADICRYGEEAAAAWRVKESQDRAEALTRFINRRAAELLDSPRAGPRP